MNKNILLGITALLFGGLTVAGNAERKEEKRYRQKTENVKDRYRYKAERYNNEYEEYRKRFY